MIDIIALSQASFMSINREVYRRLSGDRYSLELVVPSHLNFPSGEKVAQAREPDDPPIHFLKLTGRNPRVQIYQKLTPLLDLKKPRLILLDFDPASLLAVKVGRWCRKNNSKLICLSVENLPLDIVSVYKRRGWKSIPPTIIKNLFVLSSRRDVSHVFCLSNDGLSILEKLKFPSCSKTPLGFDETVFNFFPEKREKIRTSYGLNTITIAYFGRCVPEKGIHILLKALKKVEHLPWHFLMDEFSEYESPYSTEMKTLIRELELQNRITFIHVNHTEIASYMNATDVVVVPSISSPKWREQYGRVAPEAMACKNAVVVSNSGALPELVKASALIFSEGDIDELAKLLTELINSPSLVNDLKELGYQHSQNNLGLASQLSVYEEKIDILIGNVTCLPFLGPADT